MEPYDLSRASSVVHLLTKDADQVNPKDQQEGIFPIKMREVTKAGSEKRGVKDWSRM